MISVREVRGDVIKGPFGGVTNYDRVWRKGAWKSEAWSVECALTHRFPARPLSHTAWLQEHVGLVE